MYTNNFIDPIFSAVFYNNGKNLFQALLDTYSQNSKKPLYPTVTNLYFDKVEHVDGGLPTSFFTFHDCNSIRNSPGVTKEEVEYAEEVLKHNRPIWDKIKDVKKSLNGKAGDSVNEGGDNELNRLLKSLQPEQFIIYSETKSCTPPEKHVTVDYNMVKALCFNDPKFSHMLVYTPPAQVVFKSQRFELVHSSDEVIPLKFADDCSLLKALEVLTSSTDEFNGLKVNEFNIMSNSYQERTATKTVYVEELVHEPLELDENAFIVPLSTFEMWQSELSK